MHRPRASNAKSGSTLPEFAIQLRKSHMTQSSYTALVCESLSDNLSGLTLRALPLAVPGPGQVRVKIRATALNFPDYLMTQGHYQKRE